MAGWGSGLSNVEESAIDIAVRVTGQGAVTDLHGAMHALTTEIQFQKDAYYGGAQTIQEFTKAMGPLIAQQAKLEAATQRATNQLKGLSREIQITGQAGVQLAYAIDDIQYGFSAIVNNIPGIVQSLGGTAGVAGAFGVVAVGANILIKALPDLSQQFVQLGRDINLTRDPIRDATDGLKGMQEVIDALNEKPLKTDADFEAIRKLTRELEAANRAAKEWEQLKFRRTEAQDEATKQVAAGVTEGGGKTAVEDALVEIAKRNGTFAAGSELHGQIAQQQGLAGAYDAAINASGGMLNPVNRGVALLRDRALAEATSLRDRMETEGRDRIGQMVRLQQGEGSRKTFEDIVNDPANAGIFQRFGVDTDRLAGGITGARPDVVQRALNEPTRKREEARAKQEQAALDREADAQVRDKARMDREAEQLRKQHEREKKASDDAVAEAEMAAQRQVNQLGREEQRKAAKAEADRQRAMREAPARERKQAIAGFGQEFQRRARNLGVDVNGDTAEEAGRQVAGLKEKGNNVNQAMMMVFQKLIKGLYEQQAANEAALGLIGPATMQLEALNQQNRAFRARVRGIQQNQRRGAQQGRALPGIFF